MVCYLLLLNLCLTFCNFAENNVSQNKNNNTEESNVDDNNTEFYDINLENYTYFKNKVIDNQHISTNDYKNMLELKDQLDKYNKMSKRNKKKLFVEINLKKSEYRNLVRKIDKKFYIEMLFNNIIGKSDYYNKFLQNDTSVTVNELNALRVYDGKTSNPLYSRLFNNKSDFINIMSAFKMINNNSNINDTVEELRFLKESNMDVTLSPYYDELAKVENGFLKLFTNKPAYKRFKLTENTYNAYIDFNDDIIKKTNHFNKKFRGLFLNLPVFIFLYLNVGFFVGEYMNSPTAFDAFKDTLKILYGTLFGAKLFNDGLKHKVSMYHSSNTLKDAIPYLVMSVISFASLFSEIYRIHRYFNPTKFYDVLSKKFYKIKRYLTLMKTIYTKIKEDEVLYERLKDKLVYCEKLFDNKSELPKEQIQLLDLIDKFPEQWSYWKNLFKIKTCARKLCRLLLLFDKHKDMFINSIVEINDIGSYIDIVKLFKDEKYEGKICIPDISEDKTPILKADKAWNPFLDPKIAVPMNIRLGKNIKDETVKDENNNDITLKNGYSTGLLYGMNAGGKTTAIESVGLLYLLAKSYGICFAKNALMSNFARLYTVIDVTTDLSKGYSRYMSELITVDDLLNTIKILKVEGKNMLILCDEVFAGTNPEAAGRLSTNVIRKIMNSENVVSLIATHNIKPTELEKESKLLRNLTMRVDTSGNNVVHKYIIDYGLVKQSIAEGIIRKLQKSGEIKTGEDILGEKIG